MKFYLMRRECMPMLTLQMKPIEGADAEGALGFFKGMGKGIVG